MTSSIRNGKIILRWDGFRTECFEVKLQFDVSSSISIWDISLEMKLDIECFETEWSEVNEMFEVRSSI